MLPRSFTVFLHSHTANGCRPKWCKLIIWVQNQIHIYSLADSWETHYLQIWALETFEVFIKTDKCLFGLQSSAGNDNEAFSVMSLLMYKGFFFFVFVFFWPLASTQWRVYEWKKELRWGAGHQEDRTFIFFFMCSNLLEEVVASGKKNI